MHTLAACTAGTRAVPHPRLPQTTVGHARASIVRAGSGREGEGHRAHRNWQVNQPIFDSSGQWRQYLTEVDLREITEGPGRKIMEAFGYL